MFLQDPPVKNRLMAIANKIQQFLLHAPKKGKTVNSQEGKKRKRLWGTRNRKRGQWIKGRKTCKRKKPEGTLNNEPEQHTLLSEGTQKASFPKSQFSGGTMP